MCKFLAKFLTQKLVRNLVRNLAVGGSDPVWGGVGYKFFVSHKKNGQKLGKQLGSWWISGN